MATTVKFKKGDIIYREGSFEMVMYYIQKGTVSAYANYGTEDEMLYEDNGEGKYLGHLELIEAIPRSATIVAKEDVVLERIEGDEFGSYFAQRPEEQMKILTQMSARLRKIGKDLHETYETIDEYLEEEKKDDPSFLSRLARIITFGKSIKE